MLPSFASQQVTILNAATRMEWGHEVADWDHPVEETVVCVWEGASLGQARADDLDVAMGARTLFLPPGVSVSGHSRVRFPGEPGVWEVVGEPAPHTSPTGAASHVQVLVRRWEATQ